jgi:L-fuculose-phosphate aldolase
MDIRNEMVNMCNIIYREGFVSGSAGNVSVRVPGEEKILITPSQKEYEDTKPEDMLVLDFDGKVLEGNRNPSVEKNMHLAVYKAREDVGAVIHSHGIYSTALSLHSQELPPVMDEFVPYVGGTVKVAEYGESGSPELAEHAVEALEERNAVILSNHGNLCCGSHLAGALKVLRMVERVAQIYLLGRIMGPDNKEIPEDIVDQGKDEFDIFKESKRI